MRRRISFNLIRLLPILLLLLLLLTRLLLLLRLVLAHTLFNDATVVNEIQHIVREKEEGAFFVADGIGRGRLPQKTTQDPPPYLRPTREIVQHAMHGRRNASR
jgi:hypothetical protein